MPFILDVCRLCGQKKKIKIDLLDSKYNLLNKIRILLNIEVFANDPLPKVICFECQRNVDQFNSFKNKCRRVQEQLHKILSSPVTKVAKIKEEVSEGSEIHDDHTYGAPPPVQRIVAQVKREVQFEEHSSQSPKPTDSPVCNIEEITPSPSINPVFEPHSVDIKQQIVEIVPDRDIGSTENIPTVENNNVLTPERKQSALNINLRQNIESSALHYEEEEDIICEVHPAEVKLPIAEVILDREDHNQDNEEENFPSEPAKLKVELVHYETKPTLAEVSAEEVPNEVLCYDLTGDSSGEFDDKDFYANLNDNNECDINIKEVEAEIQGKRSPKKRFNCSVCAKSFKYYNALRKHHDTHAQICGSYLCNICVEENRQSHSFKTLASLKIHLFKQHYSRNVYKCCTCGLQFRSRVKMMKHIKSLHVTYRCSLCKKVCKTKRLLRLHSRVHSDERPYVCEICGRKFRWQTALTAHSGSHTREKNYLCAECGKTFASKKSLGEHANIHLGRRPYSCKTCGVTFSSFSSMNKHMSVHGEPLFICEQCNKSFRHKYQLKEHIVTHSSPSSFSCSTCDRGFTSQSGLCNHMKVHLDKNYSCEVCGQQFRRSGHLKDHMVRHTGTKHLCPAPGCGKSYTQRFPLSKHFKKSHPDLIIVNRDSGRKPEGMKIEIAPVLPGQSIQYGYHHKGDQAVVFSIC